MIIDELIACWLVVWWYKCVW